MGRKAGRATTHPPSFPPSRLRRLRSPRPPLPSALPRGGKKQPHNRKKRHELLVAILPALTSYSHLSLPLLPLALPRLLYRLSSHAPDPARTSAPTPAPPVRPTCRVPPEPRCGAVRRAPRARRLLRRAPWVSPRLRRRVRLWAAWKRRWRVPWHWRAQRRRPERGWRGWLPCWRQCCGGWLVEGEGEKRGSHDDGDEMLVLRPD